MKHRLFVFVFVTSVVVLVVNGCPNIVSRNEWGAKPRKSEKFLRAPAAFAIIHHTVEPGPCTTSNDCKKSMRSIQQYHQNTRKWPDIGYNFCIGGDGQIYEGRSWTRAGAHAPNYNSRSTGICLIGDYRTVEPPTAMITALKSLLKCGVDKGHLTRTYKAFGHRQVTSTECPGNKLQRIVEQLPNYSNKTK